MQTAETISELHARLAEAKMRANNYSWQNKDLKQEVIQRDNTIKSLKCTEQRMEKQLELAEEKKRVARAELSTVKWALRGIEQQVDRLKSEIRSLTKDLTLMKESKQERDVEVSMLHAEIRQYNTNMERNKSRIFDLCRENKTLKTQLEAKAQRYRETLQQENLVAQLKQSLDNYLLHKDQFLQNLRYCKDCHSTQQKLEELERIQRDFNQMKKENRELNDELTFRAEENKLLKNKIMKEGADCAKTIGLHKNEIELEFRTKALEIEHHRMLTNSNPGTQKRQSEERSESQGKMPRSHDSNISARDLRNDRRPPRKDDNSSDVDPDHATSYNDRTPGTMPKSSSRMTSTPRRSPDFGKFTVVAEVHPIPLKYSLLQPYSHSKGAVGDSLKMIEQKSRINSAEGEGDTDNVPIFASFPRIHCGTYSDSSTERSWPILLKDYGVTKNSNASQNQTRKPHHYHSTK